MAEMSTAKVLIQVQAGLVPGSPLPEYTKTWGITSDEWEAAENPGALLWERVDAAQDLARQLMNPNHVNWVRLDWVWL